VAAQLYQESIEAELANKDNGSNKSIEENIFEDTHTKTGQKLIITERIQFNTEDDYIWLIKFNSL